MAFDVALRDNGTGTFDVALSSGPATVEASLTANAILGRTQSGSLSAAAVIKRVQYNLNGPDIEFIQNLGTTTTGTLTLAADTTAGNRIIIYGGISTQVRVTDSKGNVWGVDAAAQSVGVTGVVSAYLDAALVAGDTITVTGATVFGAVEFSGIARGVGNAAIASYVSTTSPIEAGGTYTQTSGSSITATATSATSDPGELVVGGINFVGTISGDTFTPQSLTPPWTALPFVKVVPGNTYNHQAFYRLPKTTGTFAFNVSWTRTDGGSLPNGASSALVATYRKPSLTADAIIGKAVTGSLSASAVIKGTAAASTQADAIHLRTFKYGKAGQ